ncbi:MAG: alpha/beta fold hydrolase [Proteobacteria bacterium]|nr:alpha/beta fold hydrolase [Pseudomonadota bacterium]
MPDHPPTLLLLHGLGATGAVWRGVLGALTAESAARSWAPDLAGHGAGPRLPHYSVGGVAAALAPTLARARDLVVVGHSFGGYVAVALASGWFGVDVRGVVTIGTKVAFSADERQRSEEFARRPSRVFASRAEALERYRRVAGLDASIAPDEAWLERGVESAEAGFRLAADPAVAAVVVPSFAALHAAARCPVLAVRGALDPLVSDEELRAAVPGAITLPDFGHNLHVQSPATVLELLDRLAGRPAAAATRLPNQDAPA